MLNENELYYRKVMSAIGLAMIAFIVLFNLVSGVLRGAELLFAFLPIGEIGCEVLYQLLYAACYLLSFMLPVLVLKWRIKKIGFQYQPMKTDLKLTPMLIPIVLGGITLIWAQSNINATLVNIFTFSFLNEPTGAGDSTTIKAYQIVLIFIVNCMVPAFCEEFLFRGAILTNCLPFGRSNAILISALLFGLMHQNPAQILYAFAAGILLGVVYERTGSIWPGTFLHLINNFMSSALSIAATYFGFQVSGVAYIALECLLYAIGMICIAILAAHESPKPQKAEHGVYGKEIPAKDDFKAVTIAPKQLVRHFLNVPMIIFLSLSIVTVVTMLGSILLYGI